MDAVRTVQLGRVAGAPRIRLTEIELRVEGGPTWRGPGPVRVGKAADNQVIIADASVSSHHLELVDGATGWLLRDLDSTNGTWLNGTRVREVYLTLPCSIEVGRTRVHCAPADAAVPVAPFEGELFHGLVGKSAAMRQLFAHLQTLALTTLSVVIQGETGSGKELIARALHAAGTRAARPFVTFDCASVEPGLAAAALFGQTEGAYTGASSPRQGAFRSAHGGTLFLDEIGELPLDLQPRLLRALERREVQPLGSDALVGVDVRVVAATHRDLEQLVRDGRFRQDLLYRLAGLVLVLPALRDRPDDVVPLAEHVLAQARPGASLSPGAQAALRAHAWPGNVRELRNVIERSASLAPRPSLEAGDLHFGPMRFDAATGVAAEPPPSNRSGGSLADAEAAAIRAALKATGGNKTRAAEKLGIGRKALRDKMERFGIGDAD